ncbi:hypothetical protein [Photorhabdus stackebrandtii]|uniref:Uncharacterized protein n=1 Tax=Photorhabdus stackebrandtii TaxID=1123042 RepID=A0A7X5TMZ8_9GAMM|nr:hypothetical protein [Photorhabdus stackebrandtii]NHB98780.1 hypothetical protein [Photorhabdus stackebrandtii]
MSAREAYVSLENTTIYDLTLDMNSINLRHGEWVRYPPGQIDAGTTGNWRSDSGGFMTGTEGTLRYYINDEKWNPETWNPDNWVSVHWKIPYSGTNGADGDTSDHYRYLCKVVSNDIKGSKPHMDFQLSSK